MDPFSNTSVYFKNASKSYGKNLVLHDLNMHVEKGIIYALLGSSGCGKTTLLNCIVGRKKLDSGTVWVVGGPPGSKESAVPGKRVGYMPQDIGLIAEFTVKSAIYYFGRIFCIPDNKIKRKFEELAQLLDLPPPDRYISECSGGQQRRVSFAAALVSTPELLVLDEPTVGLDPLLRESIWSYLLKLADTHMTSIIITTHYIEEAQQAHKIGMMRNGKLLAEESPGDLLNRFATRSLEEVFLTLSQQQTQGALLQAAESNVVDSNMMNAHSSSVIAMSELGHSKEVLAPDTDKKYSYAANVCSLNPYRIRALLGKSWLQVSRNYSGVGFMFIFPICQILAFFLGVGDNVKDIKIGIYNHEDNYGLCSTYTQNYTTIIDEEGGDCEFRHMGCYFLQKLNDPMIDVVYYDDISKAKDATQHGIVSGALYIPENFSLSLHDKLMYGDFDDLTLEYSQIQVWLDMSNLQIGGVMKAKLAEKIIKFQENIFSDCQILSRAASLPVNFVKYYYGKPEDTFRDFMVPAVLISALYYLGSANSASVMLTDRLEGIWDRSVVAGVSSFEIVLVHFITQVIIISIQNVISLILTFPIYKIENAGSYTTVIIIVFLASVAGISFGFLVSIISINHSMAHNLSTGTIFPLMVLCGLMWPLEGMPIVLRWISFCLPVTMPIISLRNVMNKGWSIFHKDVIKGIGIEILWIVIFLVISLIEIKRKR